MLYGYVLWLPKNYTLDLQDGNIIALLADYVPFTILPLIPSPSLGEVSKSLSLQKRQESTVYTSKAQERKTLGGLTRGGRWAKKKRMCTDTLPWQLRSGWLLLHVYFLYWKHTKTEKKTLENKSHLQCHHTEETINTGDCFLLFTLYTPVEYKCLTALPTSTSGNWNVLNLYPFLKEGQKSQVYHGSCSDLHYDTFRNT